MHAKRPTIKYFSCDILYIDFTRIAIWKTKKEKKLQKHFPQVSTIFTVHFNALTFTGFGIHPYPEGHSSQLYNYGAKS